MSHSHGGHKASVAIARDRFGKVLLEQQLIVFIGLDAGGEMEMGRIGVHVGKGLGTHPPALALKLLGPVTSCKGRERIVLRME